MHVKNMPFARYSRLSAAFVSVAPPLPYTCAKTPLRTALSCRPCAQVKRARPVTAMVSHVPDDAYAVAPMMEVTDRHWRVLARLVSRRATLYTEMVVDRTLIHNPTLGAKELRLPPLPRELEHHPVVLQLGGSVPEELEHAARIASEYGYTEVNLNCGCPSPKVAGKGCFGAALMREPETVAEATRRMATQLPPNVPVTVKCRLGVDDQDSYESLASFVRIVAEKGGVRHFIVHARIAILSGLSPAENRTIPPLRHEFVYQLRRDFPDLTFSINGGIREIQDVQSHLHRGMHGVMVGRGCMDSPWRALCDVDTVVYGDWSRDTSGPNALTRRNVLRDYAVYADREAKETGAPPRVLIRPLLNLFYCEPRGKMFRRVIDTALRDKSLPVSAILEQATAVLSPEVLDASPPSVIQRLQAEADGSGTDSSLSGKLSEAELSGERVPATLEADAVTRC